MTYTLVKIGVSAVLVGVISEAAKRSGFWGAVLASLPITSILAMLWLYKDTGDIQRVAAFSMGVFWLVLPSLVLFVSFPLLVKAGWPFAASLLSSMALTVAAYFGMLFVLKTVGVQI